MSNPFNLGLAALAGFNNPDIFAKAMATAGISPTGAMGGNPLAPAALQGDALGGFFTPSMNEMGTTPQAVAPVAAPVDPAADPMAKLMSGLQGFKAPVQDNKPIMNAGVSGSQKAPEVGVKGLSGGSSANAAILQAILAGSGGGNKDSLRVPSLGSLLGGM